MGRSGTGLGLAVVWNTIKDHNAMINVTSDDNGTIFTIHFPGFNGKTSPSPKKQQKLNP